MTLFDVLTRDNRFDEFVAALLITSISTELKSAVHYTVFAPTDAAFRSVDRASLNRIMADVELLKSKTSVMHHATYKSRGDILSDAMGR